MASLVLRNALLLDVEQGEYREGDLLCVDGRIAESGRGLKAPAEATELRLEGAVVVPGLIDAHVHVTAATADLGRLAFWPPSYLTAHTARIMEGMLKRGFTTVRDVSGADFGLADAQAEGLLRGPRLAFCGHGLSQTGGHGDMRERGDDTPGELRCCLGSDRVVDGVDAVRTATRDELRKGADHIKVNVSGGIASPTDRMDSTQYSLEELRAIVEEAEAANRYVAAHAYTAQAVNRALEAGVRSIEHGNYIDDRSVELFLERGAFLVPTLATYWAMEHDGDAYGLPEVSRRKAAGVLDAGMAALELAHRGGVKVVFGTDLLGPAHRHQNEEFRIRAKVQEPIDVIRSATSTAAELLNRSGRIGTLRDGALADLLVLDGDPLADINALADPANIRHVVQDGLLVP
ncbi:metal-dependent hydrolase family protein [Actinomadura roseirufa]|uniref:metal-dependent hydrolase family protein n=1 Tax=Actinomadura roseirufa TaxID=2094049 RepID=UPI00104120A6|nr:amidohydrolase family protein [Actinomadura roseirufa]